jgi:hypothetical protein
MDHAMSKRRRRSWVWAALLLCSFIAIVVAIVGLLAKQDPAFYTDDAVAKAQKDDPYRASELQTRLSEIKKMVFNEPEWAAKFTQDDLNAYFREDANTNNLIEPRLAGLTVPRVRMDGDHIRLGARYGQGFFSTVVSIEGRAWVIADEPNLFAVELLSFRCGAIPVSRRFIMDRISNLLSTDNITSVSWFRNGNNPVAICRFLPSQSRASTLLQSIQISDGKLEITGRNLPNR